MSNASVHDEEGAPLGAESVAWGKGPGPLRDEPYGEEPWDSVSASAY